MNERVAAGLAGKVQSKMMVCQVELDARPEEVWNSTSWPRIKAKQSGTQSEGEACKRALASLPAAPVEWPSLSGGQARALASGRRNLFRAAALERSNNF